MIPLLLFLFVVGVGLIFWIIHPLLPKKSDYFNVLVEVESTLKEKVTAILDGKTDWRFDDGSINDTEVKLCYSRGGHYDTRARFDLTITFESDGRVEVIHYNGVNDKFIFKDKEFYNRAFEILKKHEINKAKNKIASI